MSNQLFIKYQCPTCVSVLTRKSHLRAHLVKNHSFVAKIQNHTRQDYSDYTVVSSPSNSSVTVFGCGFCADVVNQLPDLQNHYESHEQLHSDVPLKRVSNVADPSESGEWMVGEINVAGDLSKYRSAVWAKNIEYCPLSDNEILALDFIFVFSKIDGRGTPAFTLKNQRDIIGSISAMDGCGVAFSALTDWCNRLVTADVTSWHAMKRTTFPILNEAFQVDDSDYLLAATVLDALVSRIRQPPDGKSMLEDTFVHTYINCIFECIFGSADGLHQDWANGQLLGKKRKVVFVENEDENNDEENADNDTIVYKPDWVLYAKTGEVKLPLGIMEVKVAYKRNSNYISGYVKLAKEMKLALHHLVMLGVQVPMVYGVLIEGRKCNLYCMDLFSNGLYRLMEVASFELCLSMQQIVLFPTIFNQFLHLKDLAAKTADGIEDAYVARQLGNPLDGGVPYSWLRPNAGAFEKR